MERCAHWEKQEEKAFQTPLPPTADTANAGENQGLSPKTSPLARLETILLKQIMVCVFIIFFLWLIGKIPRVGIGLVDRFRHVLQYGEARRTEERITAFAREQWHKVKSEVTSWFTVEFRPVLAPPKRSVQFSSPLFYFERREVYPERIRFLPAPDSVVYASAPGVVRSIAPEKGGWKLALDHGEGWYSLYYPCPQVYVKTGERVNPGQEIARTGREFFWEVTNGGSPVDPRLFIEEQGLWR